MARDNQKINDQIFRTRSRNAAEERAVSEENQRRRQIRMQERKDGFHFYGE